MNIQTGRSQKMREKLFQPRFKGAFALAFLFSFGALAVPPPGGVAPVSVPSGGFRIDGDIMADSYGGGWVWGPAAPPPACCVPRGASYPPHPLSTSFTLPIFTPTPLS